MFLIYSTVVCAGKSVGSSNQPATKEIESGRYGLRNRERKVYTEERELCDDDYLCMYKVSNPCVRKNLLGRL